MLCKACKSMTHLKKNKVCREQGSLPNKDQKQSKRNYMSLLERDVIALSGLVERNMNQPTLTKFHHAHLGKMPFCPSIREELLSL